MNKARRKDLTDIMDKISELRERLDHLRDQEEDYYDNMPENFQDGEKGQAAHEAVIHLQDAMDQLELASGDIESAIEL